VLGGTFERGAWSLDPSLTEIERILDANAALFAAMQP
jgi:hypothetical protein